MVDEELRFAPDQPTFSDIDGRINNFIDVADFQPYTGDEMFFDKSRGMWCDVGGLAETCCAERKIPDSEFKQVIPDVDEVCTSYIRCSWCDVVM